MKKKQNELIKYLCAYTTPQKCIEIANALNLSERSIKSYVAQINKMYNKKIILSSKDGYLVNHNVIPSLMLDDDSEDIPQTDEERSFYIIKQLILEQTNKLSLFDLCDYLCVSYSTIKSIISAMNKNFASYSIKFVCENDCVKIIGNEKNKRKLISYVINEDSNNSFIDFDQLKNCFPNINVDNLRKIVNLTFKQHGYYLNDFAAINLLLHFLILIEREINGNPLNSGTCDFVIENESEQKLVLDLCCQLEEEFKIQLNKYEQFEIYMLFKANANYTSPTSRCELREEVGNDIVDLCEYYVNEINNHYMIDLNNDAFITPFSLHLKNLLFRAKNGTFTKNPMAESVKINNPIIFDIATYVGLDLMEKYHYAINEDELAFLAMHIGSEIERQNINYEKTPCILICPDYRDMCDNLLNRLLLNFGNQIHIKNVLHSEDELNDINLDEYALIFTTIPLFKTYVYQVVQISPFNLNSQFETIQEALLKNSADYNNGRLRKDFHTYFEKDLFIANPTINNKNQILPYLCDMLRVKNYVNPDFGENVNRRENAATTSFGNIAIPHSMQMDAIKTSIAVAVSKKGFQWGDNTVYIVLLLAINKADKKRFRHIYESLINIFNDKNILQEVRNCTSFSEFESLIHSYINTSK